MTNLLTRLDTTLRMVDYSLSSWGSAFVVDPPSLELFLFHPVFKNRLEIDAGHVSPFERFDLANFRELIEFYLEREYRFVTPLDLQNRLEPSQKYVWLTFDDGYANNLRIVPLLNEYRIPAIFFIATNHVLENKPFWWDVIMHFRGQQGIPRLKTLRERNYLKTLKHNEIDAYLFKEFGSKFSTPMHDLARPMTPAELTEFAKEEWVYLGNHTHNHAILTNYDYDDIVAQIEQCQVALREMVGVSATVISYPDGAYSNDVVAAAQSAGLTIGITTKPLRNTPPPTGSEYMMTLSRLSLSGDFNIRHQCNALRTNFSPLQTVRTFALKTYQAFQPKPAQS